MIRTEEITTIEAKMANRRLQELVTDAGKFVHLLEQYSWCPTESPNKELIPYLEAYRLLKGDKNEVEAFLKILLDETDPRYSIFRFVVDACEAYYVESAVKGMRLASLYETN